MAPIGSLVATIRATDVDIDSKLEYSLINNYEIFEINRYSGQIYLLQKLDYEAIKNYSLEIQVQKNGN